MKVSNAPKCPVCGATEGQIRVAASKKHGVSCYLCTKGGHKYSLPLLLPVPKKK